METKDKNVIPFIKAVHVGNFKLWRSKYALSKGKDKNEIECLHISNLDGSWMMRIPATMPLYGTICLGYTLPEAQRDQFLGMIFKNLYTLGTSASEALHYGYSILYELLSYPYLLLSEKEMVKRMKAGYKEGGVDKKEADAQIGKMCEYRKQLYDLIENMKVSLLEDYEAERAKNRAAEPEAEKQLDQDEIAEQAMDILSEEKK